MPNPAMLPSEKLAIEMAAINVVTSGELVEKAGFASDLNRLQNALAGAKERVVLVKDTLLNLEPHQVTPVIVDRVDSQMLRSDAIIEPADGMSVVEGAEALGRTLMPRDFLLTRLVGCEGFLENFFKKSREVVSRTRISFQEAYVLITQTQESLDRSIDALEASLAASPPFEKNPVSILLGERLFNLFKVNGKVSENWNDDLNKLGRTITGLSQNYYLTNRNTLQTTLGYFGGFGKLDQASAEARFNGLPSAIPSERFKECTYPSRQPKSGVVAKQSVELMGGAFFVDTRSTVIGKSPKNADEVMDWVHQFAEDDGVSFDNSSPMIFPKLGLEIKSLDASQVRAVIAHLRAVLKEWRKVVEGGEKYKLAENDYIDITKSIYEADIDELLKDKLLDAFSAIVRKNQHELLNLRVAINSYLVLVVSGLVELCHTSIKVNTL